MTSGLSFEPSLDKTFNQLIIIGNGFDLACGLESSYQAFFDNRFGDLEFNNYSDYEKFADDSTKIPHKNVWDLIFLFEKSHSSSRLGEIVEWQDVEKVISRWLAPDGIPSIRTVLGQLTNLDINSIKALSEDNETEPNDLAYLLQGITSWILKTSTHDENTSTINKRSIEAEIFNSFNESALNRPWREKERAFNNFWRLEEAWYQWYKVQKSDEQIESRYQLPFFDIGDPWVDWYITNPNSGLCRFFLNQLKEFETAFAEYVKSKQNIHPEYNTNASKLYKLISYVYKDHSTNKTTKDAVLNFNYTTPIPDCILYHMSTDLSSQLHVEQNVHGTLDSSCIFGIDGFDENNKRLEGIPRIFTKSNRQLYLERTGASTYPPNTSRTLFDAIRENGKIHCIKFYGHSLGAADYSYFRTIFNIVDIYNSDVTLYFLYSKNHPTNPEAVENLIDRYNRETLASTSANCDLLQKLLLEGRLQLRAIPNPTPDEC